MTFEEYQRHWNVLKLAVINCSIGVPLAMECLIGMHYTAREAEIEIQNWLFEASIDNPQIRPSDAYHRVAKQDEIIDKRTTS